MDRELSDSWIFPLVEILILASLLVLLPGRHVVMKSVSASSGTVETTQNEQNVNE